MDTLTMDLDPGTLTPYLPIPTTILATLTTILATLTTDLFTPTTILATTRVGLVYQSWRLRDSSRVHDQQLVLL